MCGVIYATIVGTLTFSLITLVVIFESPPEQFESSLAAENDSFDFIVFSQIWPVSSCIEWIDNRDDKSKSCMRQSDWSAWTVHGLWPSRNGQIGPLYCTDLGQPFDVKLLTDLRLDLERRWPNIRERNMHDDSIGFWHHEWEKHGRCALQSPMLGSQQLYFSAGLQLNGKLDLSDLLRFGGNIVPSDDEAYSLTAIANAISHGLQTMLHYPDVVATIVCSRMPSGDLMYLVDQIYICLNRTTLTPVTCSGRIANGVHQHCPQDESARVIKLPLTVPVISG